MILRALALAACAAGCVSSNAVPCNGALCPPRTVCRQLTAPSESVCATPDQIAACAGSADGVPCGASQECRDGVCWSFACGDGRVDSGEACDDGNTIDGDGCSSTCRSAELCGNGIVDPVRRVILPDGTVQIEVRELCDDANLADHDGCNSHCEIEKPRWASLAPDTIPALFDAAAVYDEARANVVLFGGANGPNAGETWLWHGAGWTLASPIHSPSARSEAAMAYDADTRHVVLFGGLTSTVENDTWEWDGQNWTRRAGVPPDARAAAAMAYDSARKRVVMFGGYYFDATRSAAARGDTWEWDGTRWIASAATGPAPRTGATMAYDPVRGVVVMFGGAIGTRFSTSYFADTWLYDGTTWSNPTTTTHPAARSNGKLAWDAVNQRLVLYGGTDDATAYQDMWAWSGTGWSLVSATNPPGLVAGQAMAGDPVRRRIVLFGGAPVQTTWEWDGASWRDVSPLHPPLGGSFAYDPLRARVVVLDSTAVEGDQGDWYTVATPPANRSGAALAFDTKHGVTVVFGGRSNVIDTESADTWTWDGATWTVKAPATSPPARAGARMVYDAARSETMLFGGSDSAGAKSDTWRWDGTNWRDAAPAHAPTPDRSAFALGYDPVHGRAILYGGQTDTDVVAETWTWDGTDWTLLASANQPGPLTGATLAWNPLRRRLILMGGQRPDLTYNADAWEWDGFAWTAIAVDEQPPGRMFPIVFPAVGGGMIMNGGTASSPPTDTWLLTWDSGRVAESCHLAGDDDGDGLIGCADPDCGSTCAPDCVGRPVATGMTTCDDALPHCGDGACGPIENCRICEADCACTPVCGDDICDPGETAASCPGDCP